jgi:dimethylamine---corrinoid protein Co-methyltransferase
MTRYRTRMGDGRAVEMTADEIRADIESGTLDAADRGQIQPLGEDEQGYIYELMTAPYRVVGVQPGREVILTDDGSANALYGSQSSSGAGVPVSREQAIRVYERGFCLDTMEVGHTDYSFRPVKPIVPMEQQTLESVLHGTVIPIYYGAMPNLALYYDPDGPFGNPADLMPQAKIQEAREAQELAAEVCLRDMLYVTEKMAESGADGINFDTVASAGDVEFQATLRAVEQVAAGTDLSIEVGMAAEFVLGMHGKVEYQGTRLAGLYPHQQVKVVEQAGAHVFGPVVNTNTRRSAAWNISRAVTFTKACSEAASIPIHANVGNGVGGVPMFETPPIDIVTRASAAMVEIGRVDGL